MRFKLKLRPEIKPARLVPYTDIPREAMIMACVLWFVIFTLYTIPLSYLWYGRMADSKIDKILDGVEEHVFDYKNPYNVRRLRGRKSIKIW